MEKSEVTISVDEYRELLIIKGRYEELMENKGNNQSYEPYPYKITCEDSKDRYIPLL